MLIQLIYLKLQRNYFFFDNWTINYLISFIPTVLCIIVFSSNIYRKIFHKILDKIKTAFKKKEVKQQNKEYDT